MKFYQAGKGPKIPENFRNVILGLRGNDSDVDEAFEGLSAHDYNVALERLVVILINRRNGLLSQLQRKVNNDEGC